MSNWSVSLIGKRNSHARQGDQTAKPNFGLVSGLYENHFQIVKDPSSIFTAREPIFRSPGDIGKGGRKVPTGADGSHQNRLEYTGSGGGQRSNAAEETANLESFYLGAGFHSTPA